MTKKIIRGLLVMVVFASLGLFAYNQVGGAGPPGSVSECRKCPNGDLGITEYDPNTNLITAVLYCPPAYANHADCTCSVDWESIGVFTGYVCDTDEKADCREVNNNTSLAAGCGSFRMWGAW